MDLVTFAQSSPLLAIGSAGGLAMVGYLTTQWWTVTRRALTERKRSALELEILKRKILALDQKAAAGPEVAWNGFRKFTVARKVAESEDTYSFYLRPHDGKRLPPFKPGQYLTFQFHLPGKPKPEIRCYSLSDGALNDEHYRVTIKRALPDKNHRSYDPGKVGLISSHFCDVVKEGDIIDTKAPSGKFYLDVEVERPVVLISGGIGVTPMLAMARFLTHLKDPREIYFFFGCRSGQDHMFRDEMLELQRTNPKMRLHVCYSRPETADEPGKAFNHEGRVTVERIKEILPSSNFEYYLCGPGPFMDSLVNGLYEWGVPKKDVKFEAFGPSTVKTVAVPPAAVGEADRAEAGFEVEFARSGKKLKWDPAFGNLRDFGTDHGIDMGGFCGAGSCTECMVAIKDGEVDYPDGAADVEDGCCLPCLCRPKGKLVIDA
jgi:ferredoxin-NADP reductase